MLKIISGTFNCANLQQIKEKSLQLGKFIIEAIKTQKTVEKHRKKFESINM